MGRPHYVAGRRPTKNNPHLVVRAGGSVRDHALPLVQVIASNLARCPGMQVLLGQAGLDCWLRALEHVERTPHHVHGGSRYQPTLDTWNLNNVVNIVLPSHTLGIGSNAIECLHTTQPCIRESIRSGGIDLAPEIPRAASTQAGPRALHEDEKRVPTHRLTRTRIINSVTCAIYCHTPSIPLSS